MQWDADFAAFDDNGGGSGVGNSAVFNTSTGNSVGSSVPAEKNRFFQLIKD